MNITGDESTKELTDKLKKAMKAPDWPGNAAADIESKFGLQLSPAFLQQLHKSNTNGATRIAAIRQLTLTARDKIIKEDQVEKLWLLMEDLLSPNASRDHRHAALSLLTAIAIASSNTKRFGAPMRHIMFNYVESHCNTEDAEPLFDLFSAALSEGKVLELVEDLVGPFYNGWFPKLLRTKRAEAAINLFINLTKTNAAYLDEPELLGLVKHTVNHLNTTLSEREGLLCLSAVEAVVAYCHLPGVMVAAVVAALARVLSVPCHTERAWKMMRCILGTYLGVNALFTTCELIVRAVSGQDGWGRDPHVTRGCVYFLHTALWGQQPITSLDVPYFFALPVLCKASEHTNELVIYEVAFAIKLLVAKKGPEIHPQAWTDVFQIVTNIYKFSIALSDSVKAQAVLNVVNDTVDYMEQLRDHDRFCVMRETFYEFLSPFTLLRTEVSSLQVLDFLAKHALELGTDNQQTQPEQDGERQQQQEGERRVEDDKAKCDADDTGKPKQDWLEKLRSVLHQYYIGDHRIPVRVRAAAWMTDSLKSLSKKRAHQVVEGIILPSLTQYRQEPLEVRCAAVDVLGYVVYEHNHPIITQALHLLLATVVDPFKQAHDSCVPEHTPETAADVIKAIDWLMLIFKRRMWDLPSTDAITAFRSLLTFLENHYSKPNLFRKLGNTRAKIFGMLFQIRANQRYEIGLPDEEDAQIGYGLPDIPGLDTSVMPKFTPYIIMDHKHGVTLANAASSGFRTSVEIICRRATSLSQSIRDGSLGQAEQELLDNALGASNSNDVGNQDAANSNMSSEVFADESKGSVIHGGDDADGGDKASCDSVGNSEEILKSSLQQHYNSLTRSRIDSSLSDFNSIRKPHAGNDKSLAATSTPMTDKNGTVDASFLAASDQDPSKKPVASSSSNPPSSHHHDPPAVHTAIPPVSIPPHAEANTPKKSPSLQEYLNAVHELKCGKGPDGEVLVEQVPELPETDDPWREAQRHATITYLSLTEAVATVIYAMREEKDWTILKLILEGIPKMLQNKALIVSRESNDIDYFAEALTNLVTKQSAGLVSSLYNTPDRFFTPDFELYVFLALSCLSCYRQQLSFKWQKNVVSCLTAGMLSKCGGPCIAALTLCCLEMPQTMVSSLPSILHSLTKTSATVHSSQPVLEFLSTLLHLPHIYSNFSADQYMAVFAIVIPYTNPIKFNQYVVILAFHVLAMWFLKCRLNIRRNFVNFIAKNLKNVLGPEPRRRSASLHEQMEMPTSASTCNFSSSSSSSNTSSSAASGGAVPSSSPTKFWARSQSLTPAHSADIAAAAAKHSLAARRGLLRPFDLLPNPGTPDRTKVFLDLHEDMRVTLIDLMSRYAFASCTPMARRSEVGESLVGYGQQQTWLVGLKLYTITTSGCSHRPMAADGLCENCRAVCSHVIKAKETPDAETDIDHNDAELAPVDQTAESSLSKSCTSTVAPPLNHGELASNGNNQSQGTVNAAPSIRPMSDSAPIVSGQSQVTTNQAPSTRPIGDSAANASGQSQAPNEAHSTNSGQQSIKDNHLCTCWCVGYSEVYVRQPTGNMVWMMRLQNHQQILEEGKQLSLDDLATLYGPGISPKATLQQQEGIPPHLPSPAGEGNSVMSFDGSCSFGDVFSGSSTAAGGGQQHHLSQGSGSFSLQHRRRWSDRRGSEGCPPGLGAAILKNEREAAFLRTDSYQKPCLVTSATSGCADRGVSVEEVEEEEGTAASEERRASAVHRSLSNPEIADGEPPPDDTTPTTAPVLPESSSSGHSYYPSSCAATDDGAAPVPPNISTRLNMELFSKAQAEHGPASAVSPHRTAALPAVGNVAAATVWGGAASSSSGGSPSVPPSPSKRFLRFGKFNTNINRLFGNSSSSFLSSGSQVSSINSMTGVGGMTAMESSGAIGDTKRLRHASASQTSTSQPNMSAQQQETGTDGASDGEDCDVLVPIRRSRVHTISVMNPASRTVLPQSSSSSSSSSTSFISQGPSSPLPPQPTQPGLQEIFSKPWSRPTPGTTAYDPKVAARTKETRGGVTPSNVLLQLIYAGNLEKSFERPLLVPMDEDVFSRTIRVLDLTPPLENHRIAVLYVGPGQTTEQEVLGNTQGSTRYHKFLSGLGTVVSIKKASKGFFLPGLSAKGDDGDECYVWQDEIMQVSFHVATLMPNKPNDPKFVSKKQHIGNDSVTIVYNESGKPYNVDTIKTQFNTVIVEIRPAELESNTVHLLLKPIIRDLLSSTAVVRLVSDANVALYARQIALHSVIACCVQRQLNHPEPYAGNWLRRLRTLHTLRKRLLNRLEQTEEDETTDFTDMLEKR